MYTKRQYSEPSVFSFSNFKTIIGIILSIVVLVFALIIIMIKTNFELFGLTILMPELDDSLALPNDSLIFMKSIDLNNLPPRGELVTFESENENKIEETLVRIVDFEEIDNQIVFYVSGGGYVEHKIYSNSLVRQGSFFIPNFGKFVTFLITPIGLLVCIGFPLIAILALLLVHFMELPNKNGDHTFAQVENDGYFGNATETESKKRKRGRRASPDFNDPYQDGGAYNQQGYNNPTPQNRNNNWQQYNNQPNPNNPANHANHANPANFNDPNNQYNMNQHEMYAGYDNNQYNPQQNRSMPTVESILADVTGNNYNFDDEYEEYETYEGYDDENELEYNYNANNESMPLNYSKPDTVNTNPDDNHLIVTREFFIAELQPENVSKAHEYTRGVGFQANLNDFEQNNFNIDGIDVNVDANNIQLAISEDNDSDIYITVTEEFTNVVVNKENLETSFALFKDDEDDKNKVIIRKKQLS